MIVGVTVMSLSVSLVQTIRADMDCLYQTTVNQKLLHTFVSGSYITTNECTNIKINLLTIFITLTCLDLS
jgi:hypothetical protein